MGYTALTVDDDASARSLFKIMLKRINFTVMQAEDADDALEQLATTTPDIILTDISLPGMDGIELTRTLRQREDLKDVPIIVLSAFNDAKTINRALDAGADAFYKKPLKPSNLEKRLMALMEARKRDDTPYDDADDPADAMDASDEADKSA